MTNINFVVREPFYTGVKRGYTYIQSATFIPVNKPPRALSDYSFRWSTGDLINKEVHKTYYLKSNEEIRLLASSDKLDDYITFVIQKLNSEGNVVNDQTVEYELSQGVLSLTDLKQQAMNGTNDVYHRLRFIATDDYSRLIPVLNITLVNSAKPDEPRFNWQFNKLKKVNDSSKLGFYLVAKQGDNHELNLSVYPPEFDKTINLTVSRHYDDTTETNEISFTVPFINKVGYLPITINELIKDGNGVYDYLTFKSGQYKYLPNLVVRYEKVSVAYEPILTFVTNHEYQVNDDLKVIQLAESSPIQISIKDRLGFYTGEIRVSLPAADKDNVDTTLYMVNGQVDIPNPPKEVIDYKLKHGGVLHYKVDSQIDDEIIIRLTSQTESSSVTPKYEIPPVLYPQPEYTDTVVDYEPPVIEIDESDDNTDEVIDISEPATEIIDDLPQSDEEEVVDLNENTSEEPPPEVTDEPVTPVDEETNESESTEEETLVDEDESVEMISDYEEVISIDDSEPLDYNITVADRIVTHDVYREVEIDRGETLTVRINLTRDYDYPLSVTITGMGTQEVIIPPEGIEVDITEDYYRELSKFDIYMDINPDSKLTVIINEPHTDEEYPTYLTIKSDEEDTL